MRLASVALLLFTVLPGPAVAQTESGLPDPALTPGAINPQITQANIDRTICVRGWTRTVRPPKAYTEDVKHHQIDVSYRYFDKRLRAYEEDHLIPLELGGSPTNLQNLWPEPHYVYSGWGSFVKDRLEYRLNRMVCDHKISLDTARQAIATNWITAYQEYIGPTPEGER
ncbi:hypothetical protein [Acidocella sp.]|jgi:hypothetical protein|uniref:hypothetical protein n=1 Tax=Acidocella sp. TaxID=50710 RepID=UPI002F3F1ECE